MTQITYAVQYCGGSFTGKVMATATNVEWHNDVIEHARAEFARRGIPIVGDLRDQVCVCSLDNYRADLRRVYGGDWLRGATRDDFDDQGRYIPIARNVA